ASSSTAMIPSPSLVEKMMSMISAALALEMSAFLASFSAISVLFTAPPSGRCLRRDDATIARQREGTARKSHGHCSIFDSRSMSVEYTLVGDVAVVTLARADRFNAIETTLSSGVVDAVARAADEARALVLTGSGKAFCAGADLTELIADYEARGPKLGDILDRIFHPVVAALVDAPVPTVAAINGVAAGAGLGLALACDIRIA